MKVPQVNIIAGPNGAGKTTFATEFLPKFADCTEFVNADLLALGISPFSPETAAIEAGRLMLERIKSLAERRIDFGFEVRTWRWIGLPNGSKGVVIVFQPKP